MAKTVKPVHVSMVFVMMEMKVTVDVSVIMAGMEKNVIDVDVPLKGITATNVLEAGMEMNATNAIQVTLVQTVIFVTQIGYQSMICMEHFVDIVNQVIMDLFVPNVPCVILMTKDLFAKIMIGGETINTIVMYVQLRDKFVKMIMIVALTIVKVDV